MVAEEGEGTMIGFLLWLLVAFFVTKFLLDKYVWKSA
jgi:hypothetical protein